MPLHSTLAAWVRARAGKLQADARDALAVVLPLVCASCGGVDRALCRSCAEHLAQGVRVRECQLVVRGSDGRRIPVFAAADYEGPVKALLASLKERGRVDAARPLAVLLRQAVVALAAQSQASASAAQGAAWVPVLAPSSPKSLRSRGYAHLAVLWGHAVPGARSVRGLRLKRAVRDQAGLSVAARLENLQGAYVADPRLAGARVLIVDDVVTSGATIRESVRALEAVGAAVVGCVVVAEAVRRRSADGAARDDTRGG